MFVNTVINWQGKPYRILRFAEDLAYLIALDKKTAKYVVEPRQSLEEALKNQQLTIIDDPYKALSLKRPKGRMQKIAQDNYDLIKDIVSDPDILFNRAARCAAIRQKVAHEKTRGKEQQIRRLLIAWWQRGQHPNALLPDYGTNYGKRYVGKVLGRSSATGIKRKAIDDSQRRLMEEVIRKHVLAGKASLSFEQAHAIYLRRFEQENPELTSEDAASFWQFKYFYRTNFSALEKASGRADPISYRKDVRALTGTVYDIVASAGSVYEIDSTVDNVYLVSSQDRTKVVGRPVLYVVVDVYTGMIAGVDIKLESASYQSAADAIFAACGNKKELCAKHGLSIRQEDWPIEGIPAKLVSDNAELVGDQIEWFGTTYGVELSLMPSRRPDLKSTVERSIELIQNELKPYLTGVPDSIKLKKAGGKDTRTEATFTLEEYFRAVLNAVLVVNHHLRGCVPMGFPATLAASPMNLYRWATDNGNTVLRDIRDKQQLRFSLMKHCHCSFSREGANVEGIRYVSSEAIDAGWFERNQRAYRPRNITIVIDPGNVSTAFMFPDYEHNPLLFWRCDLAPGSRHLAGKSMIEAKDYLAEAQKARALGELQKTEIRKEVGRRLEEIRNASIKAKPEDKRSKAQKVAEIVQNRHNERAYQACANPHLAEPIVPQKHPEPEKEESDAPEGGFPDSFEEIYD